MARCENCDAELQPQWKFCVRCGTKVAPAVAAPVVVEPRVVEPIVVAPIIPAAIRPNELEPDDEVDDELDVQPPARRRVDWHVAVGILVGVVGAAAIIYVIVTLTSGGG